MPQHPLAQRLPRARSQRVFPEELAPQVRGDTLRVRVGVVRRRVSHQVPEPELPARARLHAHERVRSLDPRGDVRDRTLRQRRGVQRVHLQVSQREHALLLQVSRTEELLRGAKPGDHLPRHRVPRHPVPGQQPEDGRVPRKVLEEVRRNLHHVHGAPRAAQVLVLGVRQHRVHRVPELVQERLNLRVAQRRRRARTKVANQRNRGPLLIWTDAAATPNDEMRGMRKLPGSRLQVEVDGANLLALAGAPVAQGDPQLAHLCVPVLPGFHGYLRQFHPEHPVDQRANPADHSLEREVRRHRSRVKLASLRPRLTYEITPVPSPHRPVHPVSPGEPQHRLDLLPRPVPALTRHPLQQRPRGVRVLREQRRRRKVCVRLETQNLRRLVPRSK